MNTLSGLLKDKFLRNLFLLSLSVQLLAAALFPVSLDEAYYIQWSNHLALGYLDHPPMVAWLASLGPSLGLGSNIFSYRFGGLVLSTLFFIISLSFFEILGLKSRPLKIAAMILLHFNLVGLIFRFLSTPDLSLAFFWLLALHEAAAALSRDPRRWLSAGIATGLGIQSKYIMLLIGFVFLYALIRQNRGLKSAWPYLGGLFCLLSLIAHLQWSANSDWLSWRFQLGRGFSSNYDISTDFAAKHPATSFPPEGSKEVLMAQSLLEETKEEAPVVGKKLSAWQESLKKVAEFIASQILLWGSFLFTIATGFFRRKKETLNFQALALVEASCLVPILVFAIISPFQKIEANWPAIYMIGASALLAPYVSKRLTMLVKLSFLHIALLFIVIAHCYFPIFAEKPQKDRLLKETFGYSKLAQELELRLDKPLLADSYQTTSILNFYFENHKATQFFGQSRVSELVREPSFINSQLKDLINADGFYYLSRQIYPPRVEDFPIENYWQIDICSDKSLRVREAYTDLQNPCEKIVSRWSLSEYKHIR